MWTGTPFVHVKQVANICILCFVVILFLMHCFLFEKIFWLEVNVKIVLIVLYFELFVNVFLFGEEKKNVRKQSYTISITCFIFSLWVWYCIPMYTHEFVLFFFKNGLNKKEKRGSDDDTFHMHCGFALIHKVNKRLPKKKITKKLPYVQISIWSPYQNWRSIEIFYVLKF